MSDTTIIEEMVDRLSTTTTTTTMEMTVDISTKNNDDTTKEVITTVMNETPMISTLSLVESEVEEEVVESSNTPKYNEDSNIIQQEEEEEKGEATPLSITPPMDGTTTTTTRTDAMSLPDLESSPSSFHEEDDYDDDNNSNSLLSSSSSSSFELSFKQRYFYDTPSIFRRVVRYGSYTSTTLNICPGYLQCNLVVLRKGQLAFDFLLFCQRNPKSCPLLEVVDNNNNNSSMYPPKSLAHDDADLRTDLPKYCIYRYGKLCHVINNVQDYWSENDPMIAFLLGTSFTFDYELIQAGIRLRSIEAGLNMPMYQTNIPCQSAGSLSGNMVVSMRPILASQLPKMVEITSKYPHAHGTPVCIGGDPINIGIEDLNCPDWGDAIDIQEDEIPVFHASGVTVQNILWKSGADFCITNYPGYNFVTDLPANGRDYLEHRT